MKVTPHADHPDRTAGEAPLRSSPRVRKGARAGFDQEDDRGSRRDPPEARGVSALSVRLGPLATPRVQGLHPRSRGPARRPRGARPRRPAS
jgi:hypothetical protein